MTLPELNQFVLYLRRNGRLYERSNQNSISNAGGNYFEYGSNDWPYESSDHYQSAGLGMGIYATDEFELASMSSGMSHDSEPVDMSEYQRMSNKAAGEAIYLHCRRAKRRWRKFQGRKRFRKFQRHHRHKGFKGKGFGLKGF